MGCKNASAGMKTGAMVHERLFDKTSFPMAGNLRNSCRVTIFGTKKQRNYFIMQMVHE